MVLTRVSGDGTHQSRVALRAASSNNELATNSVGLSRRERELVSGCTVVCISFESNWIL